MPISYDTVTDGGADTATSLTWSHTCSGDQLILFVGTQGGLGEGEKVTGVTYNGVSMTKVASVTEPGDNRVVQLWELIAPATGAHDVVVTLSSSGEIGAASSSYNGVRQIQQPDNSTTNTQLNNASITTSLTPVANNCWTILTPSIRVNPTAGAGSTKRNDQIFDSNGPITPPASYSMTVGGGDGGTDWGVVMASFAPAEPGGNPLFMSSGGVSVG